MSKLDKGSSTQEVPSSNSPRAHIKRQEALRVVPCNTFFLFSLNMPSAVRQFDKSNSVQSFHTWKKRLICTSW